MTPQPARRPAVDSSPGSDPWQAFSYLLTGVLLYGGVGWLLDRWLGTSWIVVVGILLGAGLGLYLVFLRFGHREPAGDAHQDAAHENDADQNDDLTGPPS